MTPTCYFCKGQVAQQPTDVEFWWGGHLKIIEQVPAGVCAQCGEKYFDAPVYKQMEHLATGKATTVRRVTVDVLRYTAA